MCACLGYSCGHGEISMIHGWISHLPPPPPPPPPPFVVIEGCFFFFFLFLFSSSKHYAQALSTGAASAICG